MTPDQLPPGPVMLPQELRRKLGIEDRCPACGESFGVTADWAELLARIDAHLAAGCPGQGA